MARKCYDPDQLWAFCKAGNTEGVRHLQLLRPDCLTTQEQASKMTPLHYAAGGGHMSTVQLLLAKGARVSAEDKWKMTPLHRAATGGHTWVVQLLLEKGAKVSCQDEWKLTPLHRAAKRGHTVTVQLLLQRGAQVSCRDQYGRTPLHSACEGGSTSTVLLLLQKGAKVSAEDNWKLTPLERAAKGGHTSVVQLLLRRGASISAEDQPPPRFVQPLEEDEIAAWQDRQSGIVADGNQHNQDSLKDHVLLPAEVGALKLSTSADESSDHSGGEGDSQMTLVLRDVSSAVPDRITCVGLALELGMSDRVIATLKGKGDEDYQRRDCYNMLQAWLRERPGSILSSLYHALKAVGMVATADAHKTALCIQDQLPPRSPDHGDRSKPGQRESTTEQASAHPDLTTVAIASDIRTSDGADEEIPTTALTELSSKIANTTECVCLAAELGFGLPDVIKWQKSRAPIDDIALDILLSWRANTTGTREGTSWFLTRALIVIGRIDLYVFFKRKCRECKAKNTI